MAANQNIFDRVVVAKYGAKWCGPCKRSHPEYEAVQASYANKEVDFYTVDIEDVENSNLPDFVLEEIERIKKIPYVLIRRANTGALVRLTRWDEGLLRKELELSLPKKNMTSYDIIKPGFVLTSDNEDQLSISSEEDENSTTAPSDL